VLRLIAVLASVALILGNGALPLTHVHLYDDHDHAEHHHGPAAHGHEQAASSNPAVLAESGPLVGPCAPDAHVVDLAATLATPSDPLDLTAAAPATTLLANPAPTRPLVARHDVRAHSPPGLLTDSPLRAPPPALPA